MKEGPRVPGEVESVRRISLIWPTSPMTAFSRIRPRKVGKLLGLRGFHRTKDGRGEEGWLVGGVAIRNGRP